MQLTEWLDRISALRSGPEIQLGLERIRSVARRLDIVPPCPVILVGGTNGKGSTVAFLDAILRTAGYRTARYTSPHLIRFTERIAIDGRDSDELPLVAAFERVESARRAAGDVPLTFFEFTTLAAFVCFRETQLDAWIIEVGLGGRLDATNILDADCAVITSIGLDHMEWLGPDRESIGREKAGILRTGRAAVIGDPDPPDSVRAAIDNLACAAACIGRDYGWQVQAETPSQWRYWQRNADGTLQWRHGLPMPALRGRFQLGNAATALRALDMLRDRLPVSAQAIRDGLVAVTWPGRFQVLPGQPAIVLDVAHNEHAARALAETLCEMAYFPETHAVFSMLGDKDISAVVRTLSPCVGRWYVAPLPGSRAASLALLTQAMSAAGVPAGSVRSFADVESATEAATAAADAADRIVVFGSFLTVAAALSRLDRVSAGVR